MAENREGAGVGALRSRATGRVLAAVWLGFVVSLAMGCFTSVVVTARGLREQAQWEKSRIPSQEAALAAEDHLERVLIETWTTLSGVDAFDGQPKALVRAWLHLPVVEAGDANEFDLILAEVGPATRLHSIAASDSDPARREAEQLLTARENHLEARRLARIEQPPSPWLVLHPITLERTYVDGPALVLAWGAGAGLLIFATGLVVLLTAKAVGTFRGGR